MTKQYINVLRQDDAAPDSLQHFSDQQEQHTGLTVRQFKAEADLQHDGFTFEWTLGPWRLSHSQDYPFYELEKRCEQT